MSKKEPIEFAEGLVMGWGGEREEVSRFLARAPGRMELPFNDTGRGNDRKILKSSALDILNVRCL